jgi:glycosyltransferase involved in cell wall biosynthesis
MRKIRILYLDDFKYMGGAEVVLTNLTNKLDKEHFEPIIAGPSGEKFEDTIKNNGIEFIQIPFDVVKKDYIKILPILKAIMLLRNIIKSKKIDIIHANSLWTLNFSVAACCFSKLPIICSVHAYPRIHSWLKMSFMKLFKWILSNRVLEYHVVSESLRFEMLKFGFPASKLMTICNGVDWNKFDPKLHGKNFRNAHNIPIDAIVVGFVGRIHPGKGTGIFVDAAIEVLEKYPSVHFCIVGDEYKTPLEDLRFKESLINKINSCRKQESFHFLGTQDHVEEVIAALDILTLPSDEETFGLSILEGMAMGKAVIGSRTGGLIELIDDGRNGILIPPKDSQSLANAMMDLIQNEDKRLRLGSAAFDRATCNYSIDKFIRKVEIGYKLLYSDP